MYTPRRLEKITTIEDLVKLVALIDSQKGKHVKELLTRIESRRELTPQLRKDVLDSYNDFARAIYVMIGYSVEK